MHTCNIHKSQKNNKKVKKRKTENKIQDKIVVTSSIFRLPSLQLQLQLVTVSGAGWWRSLG